jgi:hypothetical protein
MLLIGFCYIYLFVIFYCDLSCFFLKFIKFSKIGWILSEMKKLEINKNIDNIVDISAQKSDIFIRIVTKKVTDDFLSILFRYYRCATL